MCISIHTTRKVVTTQHALIIHTCTDFNPHHPQGGDIRQKTYCEFIRISIHTTRKVVTSNAYLQLPGMTISIHTTRKVVTRLLVRTPTPPVISIHTTRKVVTLLMSVLCRQ